MTDAPAPAASPSSQSPTLDAVAIGAALATVRAEMSRLQAEVEIAQERDAVLRADRRLAKQNPPPPSKDIIKLESDFSNICAECRELERRHAQATNAERVAGLASLQEQGAAVQLEFMTGAQKRQAIVLEAIKDFVQYTQRPFPVTAALQSAAHIAPVEMQDTAHGLRLAALRASATKWQAGHMVDVVLTHDLPPSPAHLAAARAEIAALNQKA